LAIDNVFVELDLGDRGSGLELWWSMDQGTSAQWASVDTVSAGTVLGPGALMVGTTYTLEISHDGGNGFTFSIYDAQTQALIASASADGPARMGPPYQYNVQLDTGINEAGEYGYGYVHARFDNVYLNGSSSPYETFDSAPLNSTHWNQREYVTEIVNGRLKLASEARSNIRQNVSIFGAQYLTGIRADVTLSSEGTIPLGNGRSRARLQGVFYNEKRGPGSGQDYNGRLDDVYAHIAIDIYGNGTKRVSAYVERSTAPDWSSYEELFWQPFSTPVDLDQEMALSLRFTGTQIVFQCNDETITYDVASPVYPPSDLKEVGLLARSQPSDGGGGYVVAYFDNVEVESAVPVIGDWDGDGADDVGLYAAGMFLTDSDKDGTFDDSIPLGSTDNKSVVGDWDGDGTDDVGVFKTSERRFYLDNDEDGTADATFTIGRADDVPVVGDWDQDGRDDIGVFRPSARRYYMDFNEDGLHDRAVTIGKLGDFSLVGDWDGDGVDSIGVFRPSNARFYLDDDDDGIHDRAVSFGTAYDIPVTGDWNGDGVTDVGLYRPWELVFYLDNNLDASVDSQVNIAWSH
jgi:hypothetical protein